MLRMPACKQATHSSLHFSRNFSPASHIHMCYNAYIHTYTNYTHAYEKYHSFPDAITGILSAASDRPQQCLISYARNHSSGEAHLLNQVPHPTPNQVWQSLTDLGKQLLVIRPRFFLNPFHGLIVTPAHKKTAPECTKVYSCACVRVCMFKMTQDLLHVV